MPLTTEAAHDLLNSIDASFVVVADAGADTLTATAHGVVDAAPIKFSTTVTLPAPLVAGTTYYARDIAANTFKVAATSGGAAINLTDTGTGVHSAVPVMQVELYTVKPKVDASGGTEVSTSSTGYARVDVTIGAASSRQRAITTALSWTPIGAWGNVDSWGLRDRSRNKLKQTDWFYTSKVPVAVTASAGADTLTATAHGFTDGMAIMLTSTGSLPGGYTAETRVFVVQATADTFKISLTSGGAAIDLTSAGSGLIIARQIQLSDVLATTPTVAIDAGALIIRFPTR